MLIGLIIALIFGFSRGAESEFAPYIPNIKKEIKRNVPDKSRKDTLLLLVKDYEKTIKKYDKEKKKLQKKVNKAGTDREVSTEVFLKHYDDYYNSRIRLMSKLIDYRLMFQEQITEEELLLVAEKADFATKKERRKEDKAAAKAEDKLNKVFLDINDIILKHIQDPAKTKLVTKSLNDFETTIYNYVDEARDLVVKRHIMLDDKNATREEIDEIFKRSDQLRFKASRDFSELREVIIMNTDKREWKAINKEMKVFLKS